MATVTKLFTFLSSAESYVGVPGSGTTMTWDSGVGNPAGSLKARLASVNTTSVNYWRWTGTWVDLGVPSGSIITHVRIQQGYTRCTEYNKASNATIGPYSLHSSDGSVTIATLWSGRTATGVEGSWTAIGQQSDQAIGSSYQLSSTTIQIRLYDTLRTSVGSGAAQSAHDDQTELVITYQTADNLTATDITTPVAVLDQSTIGQSHALSANEILTPTPILDQSTIGQTHFLTADEILTLSPILDTPTVGEVGPYEIIFDHEEGDESEYTDKVDSDGDISVIPAAAMGGSNYGLAIIVDDDAWAYERLILTESVSGSVWRAGFFFNPNNISWANGTDTELLVLQSGAPIWGEIAIIKFGKTAGGSYEIHSMAQIDDTSYDSTPLNIITGNEVHWIEIEVVKSDGSNNGRHRLWIDDLVTPIHDSGSILDNDTRASNFQYLYFGVFGGANYYSTPGGTIYLDELTVNNTGNQIGLNGDSLVATDITTPAPILDQSTIAQTHALSANEILTPEPILDQSSIGQTHPLNANEILTPTPILDQSTIGQSHALSANEILTPTPILDQSTIGQTHALSANEILTPVPILDQSSIGQTHPLNANEILTPEPVLDQSSIGQTHALNANEILTPEPVLDQSSIGQTHALNANEILTPEPVLDQSSISQIHQLQNDSLISGIPVLDAPSLDSGMTYDLISTDITTEIPILDQSSISQTHSLTTNEILTPVPILDQSSIGQSHVLSANEILTPEPILDQSTVGQTHSLISQEILSGIPILDQSTIGQTHVLNANEILTPEPILGAPSISEVLPFELFGEDIETEPVILGTPTIGQSHALSANEILTSEPILDQSTIGQTHSLNANEILTIVPILDQSTIGQTHSLVSQESLSGIPILSSPIIWSFIPYPTPESRIYDIELEDREYIIDSENREYVISRENREILIE